MIRGQHPPPYICHIQGILLIGYTDTIDNHITYWSNFADF
eukprot:SAG11_NODE_44161_length_158_cov_13.203390_1_plen_39_part_01